MPGFGLWLIAASVAPSLANSASSSSAPRSDLFRKLGFEKRDILFRDETIYGKWSMKASQRIFARLSIRRQAEAVHNSSVP